MGNNKKCKLGTGNREWANHKRHLGNSFRVHYRSHYSTLKVKKIAYLPGVHMQVGLVMTCCYDQEIQKIGKCGEEGLHRVE